MRVVTTRDQMRRARRSLGGTGFVPTMGYLHDGHLSLVRAARAENESVVASIFVNPTQFGPSEDLASYPRDTEGDLAKLEAAGVDVAWLPAVEDIYPSGAATFVDVQGITAVLEGASRPGHFRGVATVVTILLNIVAPDRAYFGQKDAQQLAVIKAMVRDLGMGVDVIAGPTRREPDGLAMSSRNAYLDADDRAAAPVLRRALDTAERLWASGVTDAEALRSAMLDVLAAEPRAVVDYVSVADPNTLVELGSIDPRVGALASMAVRVGKPRLIDNQILASRPSPA